MLNLLLYTTVLYCFLLFCTLLYSTLLYTTVLFSTLFIFLLISIANLVDLSDFSTSLSTSPSIGFAYCEIFSPLPLWHFFSDLPKTVCRHRQHSSHLLSFSFIFFLTFFLSFHLSFFLFRSFLSLSFVSTLRKHNCEAYNSRISISSSGFLARIFELSSPEQI